MRTRLAISRASSAAVTRPRPQFNHEAMRETMMVSEMAEAWVVASEASEVSPRCTSGRRCKCVSGYQHDDHLEREGEQVEDACVPRRDDAGGCGVGSEPPRQQSPDEGEQHGEDVGVRHEVFKEVDRDGGAAAQEVLLLRVGGVRHRVLCVQGRSFCGSSRA